MLAADGFVGGEIELASLWIGSREARLKCLKVLVQEHCMIIYRHMGFGQF